MVSKNSDELKYIVYPETFDVVHSTYDNDKAEYIKESGEFPEDARIEIVEEPFPFSEYGLDDGIYELIRNNIEYYYKGNLIDRYEFLDRLADNFNYDIKYVNTAHENSREPVLVFGKAIVEMGVIGNKDIIKQISAEL